LPDLTVRHLAGFLRSGWWMHLERLVDIASAAGAAVMRYYRADSGAECKSDGSPLTAADRAAHECIVSELRHCEPEIPLVSEEGSDVPPLHARRFWRRFWLVDPLDGTKEFLAANGEFTVNIALIEQGLPVMGVVAAPALGVVYFASHGRGSWRRIGDGATERIVGPFVGASPVTRVVESRSHPTPALEAYISALGPVERIKLGSSLKFCRVAEGRADLYPRFGPTMEWDVAAGDCVFRNSGRDGRLRPSPLVYNQPSLRTDQFLIGEDALALRRQRAAGAGVGAG
jgi:3'(2'), 5'-bisphosphate nucleotidase